MTFRPAWIYLWLAAAASSEPAASTPKPPVVAEGSRELSAPESFDAFRTGTPRRIHSALETTNHSTPQRMAGVGKFDQDGPSSHQERGTLQGTLLLDGKQPSDPGVVMLWPEDGKPLKRPPKFAVVEQRNKAFSPHLSAVPVGSTVAFPNFDSIVHNVFSLSSPKRFDLGLYNPGDERQVVFDKPGIIRIGCRLHANMSAYLVVIDAPQYTVSQKDGSFTLKSLRPGKYKVQAWNEQSSDPVNTEITIKAGHNQMSIDLKSSAAQGASRD